MCILFTYLFTYLFYLFFILFNLIIYVGQIRQEAGS